MFYSTTNIPQLFTPSWYSNGSQILQFCKTIDNTNVHSV
nr:MAG TPA: hypothetical protein [Caudoviricetes sp.]